MYAASKGQMIDAHTARYNGRLASMGIPFAVIITATDEKLLAFDPSEEHKGYFGVRLEVLLQAKIPDDNILASDPRTRRGADAAAALVNGVNRVLDPQAMDMTFRIEEDGWQIPGSHEVAAVEAAMDKLFKAK
ncbi:MAG: hypothetical protein JWL69_3526 [Phycisphaerales bacterium]|nr:hypothetical protein [Phycisphaerales bacterium]MDB5356652.1 hypothetical protein [Phycisphaerales bacterium]